MIKNIEIDVFKCTCIVNPKSSRVVYMVYPLVNGFSEDWLETQSQKNECSIVVVYVPLDKWNDFLTPWPEPGETPKAEPFAGQGMDFLEILQTKIIPKAEQSFCVETVTERDLVGVSLGGLFTFWQWMQCDTFMSIASLSGSFWYEGFIEWFEKQTMPSKSGKAYFLLGTEEPEAKIKAYRTVGINTEIIVTTLKQSCIDTTFEWVHGNHFANPMQRAEKALEHLR